MLNYLIHCLKCTLEAFCFKWKKQSFDDKNNEEEENLNVNGIDIGYGLPRNHFIFLVDSIAVFYREWFYWAA